MKKLWKVTANNWGWAAPRTMYFETKAEAREYAENHPANDGVEYAGNFTAEKADALTGR